MPTKEEISGYFMSLQDNICKALEKVDGNNFREDLWERAKGGGGRTRIIEGQHIEKGGVNYSAVHGKLPKKIRKALKIEKTKFYATGVSIVLHPKNPHVPIIHMNVRYFEMDNGIWWFGGGIDLTPHYIVDEEATLFHQTLQEVCDEHHLQFYPKFKGWADEYFYIKHREETRGIGGIFFDRLNGKEGMSKERLFEFVKSVGETFAPLYLGFLNENKNKAFTQREKQWQLVRRGRYVEFNLVWDKGTKFGLDTGGRIESILMSLPQQASWIYDFQTEEGSAEANTLSKLKRGIDWVNA